MKYGIFAIIIFLAALNVTAIDLGINKSMHIPDGETRSDGCATVNGCISIGSNCTIEGSCSTVNGIITVGNDTKVNQLQTVNGGITIGSNVLVKHDVQTVNGNIMVDKDGKIYGDVATVNGCIELVGTQVEQDVTTHNGDIELMQGTVIKHDIIIKHSSGNNNRDNPLSITIAEESIVEGDIIVKDDEIEVIVYLEDGGKVLGQVYGAKVVE